MFRGPFGVVYQACINAGYITLYQSAKRATKQYINIIAKFQCPSGVKPPLMYMYSFVAWYITHVMESSSYEMQE